MAKINVDLQHVVPLLDLLNKGKEHRAEVKARLLQILAAGNAGPETQKLAAEVFGAKRGKPKYGTKNRWFDVGQANDELRDAGMPPQERIEVLRRRFTKKKGDAFDNRSIEKLVATYDRAMESAREDREKILNGRF
jgi:hypothetical protein